LRLRLVLDTNKAISSLVRDGLVRRLILHPAVELYAPEFLIKEIAKHEEEILRKVPGELFRIMMGELKGKLISVEAGELLALRGEAERIAREFDIDDWPFVASALRLGIPIWTNDRALIEHSLRSSIYLAVDTVALLKALRGELDLEDWRAVKEDIRTRIRC